MKGHQFSRKMSTLYIVIQVWSLYNVACICSSDIECGLYMKCLLYGSIKRIYESGNLTYVQEAQIFQLSGQQWKYIIMYF